MQDKILGENILTLPDPHREDVTIKFNSATEILYRAVENKFHELIAVNILDRDDPRAKMKYFIVMLLRLRQ